MRIAQIETYQGNDWWSWAVWIEGKTEELREIEAVIYTLHPSFAHPVRKVTDRRSKFRLTESGWGGFTIYARILQKTGKERNLKHELALYYPDGEEVPPVMIRINDPDQTDPSQQVEALRLEIEEAAPDAVIKREAAPGKDKKTVPAALNILLTGPALFSIAKGIQGWLSRNPQATVDLQQGETTVSGVTASNVLKTLNSLSDSIRSKVASPSSSQAQSQGAAVPRTRSRTSSVVSPPTKSKAQAKKAASSRPKSKARTKARKK
jgi:hypothetical protein